MKDEILNYWDMCSRHGMALQRGMYFRLPPTHGVILMSRRPNAPYADEMTEDESILVYEGHDARKTTSTPDPKTIDQPRYEPNGKPTQNGLFADSVDTHAVGRAEAAIFRVYEKMRDGVWTDRGLYVLRDYSYEMGSARRVFKFWLEQADFDSSSARDGSNVGVRVSRQIPSWVKQEVYRRDKGRCVMCGAADNLHFDHDLPFSKGGTSVLPANVRILCARHNLEKSARIE